MKGMFGNRSALVTGGTTGVGLAIARQLAEEDARAVALVGRVAERGAEAAQSVEAAGAQALFLQADLGSVDACRAVYAEASAWAAGIESLMNAAAATTRGSLLETSVEDWDSVFALNVRAPFVLAQAFARERIACGAGGSILNILSALPQNGSAATPSTLGWTYAQWEDATQRRTSPLGDQWLTHARAMLPMGELIQPEEAARLAAFLLSYASGVATGPVIDFGSPAPLRSGRGRKQVPRLPASARRRRRQPVLARHQQPPMSRPCRRGSPPVRCMLRPCSRRP